MMRIKVRNEPYIWTVERRSLSKPEQACKWHSFVVSVSVSVLQVSASSSCLGFPKGWTTR